MISSWYVLLAGLGGGIVNSLLLERNRLIMPALQREDGRLLLDLGFVSNIALGVAAAFLPYLFGVAKLTHDQQLGVSLVAAIGGASFMSGLVQSRLTTVRAAQADAFERIMRVALGLGESEPSNGQGG